jgi:hypothetical protein
MAKVREARIKEEQAMIWQGEPRLRDDSERIFFPRRRGIARAFAVVGMLWGLGIAEPGYASEAYGIFGGFDSASVGVRAAIQDKNGYIFVAGTVSKRQDSGSLSAPDACYSDAFVAKMDSKGRQLWSRRFGGDGSDACNSLGVDSSGCVYVTGFYTWTFLFDSAIPKDKIHDSKGTGDIFVLKLERDGDLAWVRGLGGPLNDTGYCLSVDSKDSVCVAGVFGGTVKGEFNQRTVSLTSVGADDVFVVKLTSDGGCQWAESLGGQDMVKVYGMGVDRRGGIALAGVFSGSADFDPGEPDTGTSCEGPFDAFVMKLDASGRFEWGRRFGGPYRDSCKALAVDADGSVYATGAFAGTADFDPGEGRALIHSEYVRQAYVLKLNRNGNYVWATEVPHASRSIGQAISVDGIGRIIVGGVVSKPDAAFAKNGAFEGKTGDVQGAFASAFNSDGRGGWHEALSRSGDDSVCSIVPASHGNVFVAGCLTVASSTEVNPGETAATSGKVQLLRIRNEPELVVAEREGLGNVRP